MLRTFSDESLGKHLHEKCTRRQTYARSAKLRITHRRRSIFKPLKSKNKIRQKKNASQTKLLSFAVTRTIYPAQCFKEGTTIGKGNESALRSPAVAPTGKQTSLIFPSPAEINEGNFFHTSRHRNNSHPDFSPRVAP